MNAKLILAVTLPLINNFRWIIRAYKIINKVKKNLLIKHWINRINQLIKCNHINRIWGTTNTCKVNSLWTWTNTWEFLTRTRTINSTKWEWTNCHNSPIRLIILINYMEITFTRLKVSIPTRESAWLVKQHSNRKWQDYTRAGWLLSSWHSKVFSRVFCKDTIIPMLWTLINSKCS